MSRKTRPLLQRFGLSNLKRQLRQSGVEKIQQRRQLISQRLEDASLPGWEWIVLTGQLRELNAAQGIVETLFPPSDISLISEAEQSPKTPFPSERFLALRQSALSTANPNAFAADPDFQTIKSVILDRLVENLSGSLANQTEMPLEVDILKLAKKQELFLIVLKQFEALLDELRFSQVLRSQLSLRRSQLLQDLWQNATTDFFGKYRTVASDGGDLSALSPPAIVPQLLQDAPIVTSAILDRIPLFVELVDHLLFHSDLVMDQQVYPVGSSEAFLQSEAILGNLVLQVSNGVVQPLINRFSAVDELRRDFFDRRWLSTREIERFRNGLSWKYRIQQWVKEPADIFESQYRLLVFSEVGIQYRTIYAARDPELKTLSGIPFMITLALEAKDAIAPPLQAAVTFLGRGAVFLLTQIIGRSIGLVGRGVLQGIGYVRGELRSPSSNQSANQRQP
jgi:hypothetical protein